MGKRRSLMRAKKYDDAYKRKTNRPWSNLTDDVLSLVMMKLELVDFLAFSKVCKSWRSLAVPNRNKFIVSKPPMSISFPDNDDGEKRDYYLEDFEGRKLKINLPHSAKRSAKRWCTGVTCGYLIFYGGETDDFWLVNLITRHQLHFPDIPFCCPGNDRTILVFSALISNWVLVASSTCYNELWYSIAGEHHWTKCFTPFDIHDLIAFKGKIYTVHHVHDSDEMGICEMKLYPEPELVLLISSLKPGFRHLGFVRCSKNLYVIDRWFEHPYKIHEIDLEEMKFVSREEMGQEYAFFHNKLMYDLVAVKNGKACMFKAKLWYFFHDCLKVNRIHEGLTC